MITKEVLEDLCIKQKKTRREIAKELNVSVGQVSYYLYLYKIKIKINVTNQRRICPICGKCFITSSNMKKVSKYCSRQCFIKNKNLNNKKAQKYICDYCKKEFFNLKCKINNKHHFCCEEHSKLWRKENEKKPNHICPICGKAFYDSHKKERTCSRECGKKQRAVTYSKFTEEKWQEIHRKEYDTKNKNKTWISSKPEQLIKKLLKNKFKEIRYQYKSELYPFNCDFYIPSLDLYIEYQGDPSHGKEPYDINNFKHQDLLNKWQDRLNKNKSKGIKNSRYYFFIDTWTRRDPLKRETARKNNLNWIEFFTIDEFMSWFEKQ